MRDVAQHLPTSVVTTLLGVDHEKGVELYELVEIMHSAQDVVTEDERMGAREKVIAFGLADAQKLATPDESMASNLVHAQLRAPSSARSTSRCSSCCSSMPGRTPFVT